MKHIMFVLLFFTKYGSKKIPWFRTDRSLQKAIADPDQTALLSLHRVFFTVCYSSASFGGITLCLCLKHFVL